mmetsp:Transcript_15177/g.52003  ORF Transcript_15177/g.52003 Transcript_15177/m.52003 type:complete len:230 (+) Transcript_15177:3204-3893(+)
MDSTSLTMGRSPSESAMRNAPPWSTKMVVARPAQTHQTKEIGAETRVSPPRSSTSTRVLDRQNAFHLTTSSRFQTPAKTRHVIAPTTASVSSWTTVTTASGFSSWSRDRQTSSRGRPQSSAQMKKFAPLSASDAGVGSYSVTEPRPWRRQFFTTSTPQPRRPTTRTLAVPRNFVVSAPSAAFCLENLFACRRSASADMAEVRARGKGPSTKVASGPDSASLENSFSLVG